MSVFNQQQSKVSPSQMGVVDQTAGMNSKMLAGAITEGMDIYGDAIVSRANNQMKEAIVNFENDLTEQEQNVMSNIDSEIYKARQREKQGIYNKKQLDIELKKIQANAIALAPAKKDAINNIFDNGLTSFNKKIKSQSEGNLQAAADKAWEKDVEVREGMALGKFGKSYMDITPEQRKIIDDYKQTEENIKIEKAKNDIYKQTTTRNKLEREAQEEEDKIFIRKADVAYDNLINTDLAFINSKLDDNFSIDELNVRIANAENDKNNMINRVTAEYNNAGLPVPQERLNNINTRYNTAINSLKSYSKLSQEERTKYSLDLYNKKQKIEQSVLDKNESMLDQTQRRIELLSKEPIKMILGDDVVKAKENARLVLPAPLFDKYYGSNAIKFDNESDRGVAVVEELLRTATTNSSVIKEKYGNEYLRNNNIALSRIDGVFMPDDNKTLLAGDNQDPQDQAIKELADEQRTKFNNIIETATPENVAKGLAYTVSNLKMYTSKVFSIGDINSERGQSRASSMSYAGQQAANEINVVIQKNPYAVQIDNKTGAVDFANDDVQKAYDSLINLRNKVPEGRFRDELNKKIAGVREEAIQSTVINPLVKKATDVLNEDPAYINLSQAEKQEIIEKLKQDNKIIRMAQGAKDFQLQKLEQEAAAAGNVATVNNPLYTGKAATIYKNARAIAEGDEFVKPMEYFAKSTAHAVLSVTNDVSKLAKDLFGDSIEEKVEKAYDKKLGIPRAQAGVIKSLENKTMTFEKAKLGYDRIIKQFDMLEDKVIDGDDLTPDEEKRFRYLNLYKNRFEKNYSKEIKASNKMPEEKYIDGILIKDEPVVLETTEEQAEGYEDIVIPDNNIDESLYDEPIPEGTNSDNFKEQTAEPEPQQEGNSKVKYKHIFDNEIGRGDNESRKLHVPSSNSGVTIGPGYDLAHRTKDEVVADLTDAGIDEAQAQSIAQGVGLTGEEAKSFADNNQDINITDEQEEILFNKVVPEYEERAKRDYDSLNIENKPAFDSLPQTVQELLVDYAYNVGVKTFPNFFTSLIKGDKEKAMDNYTRYTTINGKKVPLGKRNDDTLALLNGYDFKDLTV